MGAKKKEAGKAAQPKAPATSKKGSGQTKATKPAARKEGLGQSSSRSPAPASAKAGRSLLKPAKYSCPVECLDSSSSEKPSGSAGPMRKRARKRPSAALNRSPAKKAKAEEKEEVVEVNSSPEKEALRARKNQHREALGLLNLLKHYSSGVEDFLRRHPSRREAFEGVLAQAGLHKLVLERTLKAHLFGGLMGADAFDPAEVRQTVAELGQLLLEQRRLACLGLPAKK